MASHTVDSICGWYTYLNLGFCLDYLVYFTAMSDKPTVAGEEQERAQEAGSNDEPEVDEELEEELID